MAAWPLPPSPRIPFPSPSGLMLRMFSYLYDMDVVEEEAFMKWKEDISQQFPGKGKALFQVGALKDIFSLIHTPQSCFNQCSRAHSQAVLPRHVVFVQVNQWLVLLEEAEVESTDEDDD